MNQASTAIRLFQAVNNIDKIEKIGTWSSKEEDFNDEYCVDDDEEEEEEEEEEENDMSDDDAINEKSSNKSMNNTIMRSIYRKLENVSRRSKAEYIYGMSYNEIIKIKAKDYSPEILDNGENEVKELYNNATNSGFGDMKKLETVIDENVRKAKEYNSSECKPSEYYKTRCTEFWTEHFFPHKNIDLQFYKMNIYGPGGKFVAHKDTPEPGLIGTVILNIYDKTRYSNKPFILENQPVNFSRNYMIAFFTDVVHEVSPIESGYRITLVYKVFVKKEEEGDKKEEENKDTDQMKLCKQEIVETLKEIKKPYGILLSHEYILENTVTLKGHDLILEQCLENDKYVTIPVVVKFHADKPVEDQSTCSSSVYPFTDQVIEYISNNSNKQKKAPDWSFISHNCKNIPFFSFNINKDGFLWAEKNEDSCEYTGNESRDGEEDAIYLNYAIIVYNDNNNNTHKKLKK